MNVPTHVNAVNLALILAIGIALPFSIGTVLSSRPTSEHQSTKATTTNPSSTLTSRPNEHKPQSDTDYQTLLKLVKRASRTQNYTAPSNDELRSVEILFQQTLAPDSSFDLLRRRWNEFGFVFEQIELENGIIWFLYEQSQRRFGRGCYAFRKSKSDSVAYQAPHCFYDERTREISSRLFLESSPRAIAWNSIHREQFDAAHQARNYLNAFTKALVKEQIVLTVQIHGFSQQKRSTDVGHEADVVLSNGGRQLNAWIFHTGVEFTRTFGNQRVKTYPIDITELGATTNSQAQIFRDLRCDGFLHIELSRPFRWQLVDDTYVRGEFLRCINRAYTMRCRENG